MKNSFFALVLLALIAADARATIWEGLTDAQRSTLSGSCITLFCDQVTSVRNRSRRTPHENEAGLPPIFDEVTLYILVNATPARTAAVMSDYTHYTTHFGSVGMRGTSIVSGAMPTPRVRYDLFVPVADITVRYELDNTWSCNASGTYRDSWEIANAASNTDVAHVEGHADFEAVTLADGSRRTLVRYYNYLNVRNPDGRDILDNAAARSTNVRIAQNMMRQLRNAAENASASVVAAEGVLTSSTPCR